MNEENRSGVLGALARGSVELMNQPFGTERRSDFINYGFRWDLLNDESDKADNEMNEKNVPKNGCINVLNELYLKPYSKTTKNHLIKSKNHKDQEQKEPPSIPKIIVDCVEIVETKGIDEVGIYRISETVSEIQKLKDLYPKRPIEVKNKLRGNPHLAASVLKSYLRDIPEPLLTYDLYPAFINSIELNEDAREECLCKFFNELIPETNRSILTLLFTHLVKISNNSEKNLMPIQNLATIFGPIFLKSPDMCDAKNIFTLSTQQISVVSYMLELVSKRRLIR